MVNARLCGMYDVHRLGSKELETVFEYLNRFFIKDAKKPSLHTSCDGLFCSTLVFPRVYVVLSRLGLVPLFLCEFVPLCPSDIVVLR